MKPLITLAGAGLMLAATSAFAQDARDPIMPDMGPSHTEPMPMPEPMQTQEVPPAETPPPAPRSNSESGMEMASFTDEQIAAFARAAVQMRELNSNADMDDLARRTEAEMIIAREGLDPQTYSAIGAAASNDPAIAQRVQVAVEEIAGEPEG